MPKTVPFRRQARPAVQRGGIRLSFRTFRQRRTRIRNPVSRFPLEFISTSSRCKIGTGSRDENDSGNLKANFKKLLD